MQVTVDKKFARFGEKSYAIDKINTVEVRSINPYGNGWAFICMIISLSFSYGAYRLYQDGDSPKIPIFICIFFAIAAYRLWIMSKIVEFQLFLMTSSTSLQAYSSFDRAEISDLRNRIESAMAGHDH